MSNPRNDIIIAVTANIPIYNNKNASILEIISFGTDLSPNFT